VRLGKLAARDLVKETLIWESSRVKLRLNLENLKMRDCRASTGLKLGLSRKGTRYYNSELWRACTFISVNFGLYQGGKELICTLSRSIRDRIRKRDDPFEELLASVWTFAAYVPMISTPRMRVMGFLQTWYRISRRYLYFRCAVSFVFWQEMVPTMARSRDSPAHLPWLCTFVSR